MEILPQQLAWLASVLVCVYSFQPRTEPELQCRSLQQPQLTFNIISTRNATGHWLSQLDYEHGGQRTSTMSSKHTSGWSLGVEQSSTLCGGIESNLHTRIHFSVPAPSPRTGYTLFPNIGYYKFHTSTTNWTQARQTCADEGAHLVIINSEAEAEAMKSLYARYPKLTSNWAWVGLYEATLNEYVSIFGESLESTGFMRWVPGQPDDAGLEDCVVFRKQTGGLEDTPCKNGFHFVCERELW